MKREKDIQGASKKVMESYSKPYATLKALKELDMIKESPRQPDFLEHRLRELSEKDGRDDVQEQRNPDKIFAWSLVVVLVFSAAYFILLDPTFNVFHGAPAQMQEEMFQKLAGKTSEVLTVVFRMVIWLIAVTVIVGIGLLVQRIVNKRRRK